MATKKGSKVSKMTSETLRLEILSPHEQDWGIVSEADKSDQEQLDHVTEIASRLKNGPIKYRLIERSVTTRTTTSEMIVEGTGKGEAPR